MKKNNIQINTQAIKDFFIKLQSQFDKVAVVYLVLFIAITFYGVFKIVAPNVSSLFSNINELFKTKDTVKTMQKRIELREREEQLKDTDKVTLPVRIYKAPYDNLELENAAAGLVNEIISIIKNKGRSKIISLEFERKKLKDKLGVVSKKHAILSLKIELESSYEIIQNVLNEVYLMDYLIKIDTLSLSSMKKYNYQRVQAFMIMDLYIETSS